MIDIDIYTYVDTYKKSYFKRMCIGNGRYTGMFLWQPMKKFLWFYVTDHNKQPFWLDDDGFEVIA